MKKLFILISILFATLAAKSESDYYTYFTNEQLRIDYYIFGNADTCTYALDKYVMEPIWGGTRNYLVDSLGYGDYLFEVMLHDSDVVIYSRGYCNLFGEWQTTPEAELVTRGFNESVIALSIHSGQKKNKGIVHIFFHPDCTVGTGIAPVHAHICARGLYRRWGIAPRPEDTVQFP